MKKISTIVISGLIIACLFIAVAAQKTLSKDELLQKMSKLSKSNKPDDKRQAYELGKEYLKRFSTDTDDNFKKVKDYVTNEGPVLVNEAFNKGNYAEGFALGKQILADDPDNPYINMSLAYAGYDAFNKKQDKTFADDSINYAKKTLGLFEQNKLPKQFSPFKDKNDATALMYYTIATLEKDKDSKQAAKDFYQSLQYESQLKTSPYTYNSIAIYYEETYQKLGKEYQTKYTGKPGEEAAMKADEAKLQALVERMLDAYARVVKYSENTTNPNKELWKQRFVTIYNFRFQSDKGMDEYLNTILSKPLPDPATI
jgi:hypothetical protein